MSSFLHEWMQSFENARLCLHWSKKIWAPVYISALK